MKAWALRVKGTNRRYLRIRLTPIPAVNHLRDPLPERRFDEVVRPELALLFARKQDAEDFAGGCCDKEVDAYGETWAKAGLEPEEVEIA